MAAIFLYLATTIALIRIWRRFVQPVSAAASIALVLLPLCFTGRALLTGRVYGPIDLPYMAEPLRGYAADYGVPEIHNGTLSDLYTQMIPWQHAVRHALANDEWPVWNPFLLCGSILAANMQAAPYDWVNVLGLLLSHAQSLTFAAAMAFFLAGFFTFFFARALGIGEVASLAAAAGYMFNAMLAFFIGWPLAHAWTYLPLVLIGVRFVAREPSLRATVLLALGFVGTILAGHPESILHIVVIGAVYGLFEVIPLRRAALKPIACAVVAGIVSLLLTAIALLPFLDVAPYSAEYDTRHNLYANWDFQVPAQEIAHRAARTFFAYYGGRPEHDNWTPLFEPSAPRVGAIVLALSLSALTLARKKRETWFFLAVALISLCAAFEAPPVASLLHELPLFDITINNRLAFSAAFALAMLAALALDHWPAEKRRAFACAAIVVLTGAALAVVTSAIRNSVLAGGVERDVVRTVMTYELVPLAMVAVLLALRVRARVALPLVLGLILVQRTLVDGSMYPAAPQRAFYPPVPILAHMQSDPRTPFRIAGHNFALIPDGAALYGLEDVRGYEAMTFGRLGSTYPLWSRHQPVSFNIIENLSRPFLSFLNVRYAISDTGSEPPDGWRLVLEDRGARLFENMRVLPRVFVPRRVRYERSGADVVFDMSHETDFAQKAWITVPSYKPHDIVNGPGTVHVRRDGSRYEIDADMQHDGWIVVSESKWPGWRAYVDGKRIETQYANHAFLGVFVPAGKHQVRLVYVPQAFTRGRNISFVTVLALAILLLRKTLWSSRRTDRV